MVAGDEEEEEVADDNELAKAPEEWGGNGRQSFLNNNDNDDGEEETTLRTTTMTTNIMLISFMAMPRTISRQETDTAILFISWAFSRWEFAPNNFPARALSLPATDVLS